MNNTVFNYQELVNKYKGLPVTVKNEEERILLGKLDMIHDFNDEGGRVPNETWSRVLPLMLQYLNTQPQQVTPIPTNIMDWLSTVSSRQITASKVEEQTVSYFEKEFSSELKTPYTKILTYRNIIDAIKAEPGVNTNEKIYQAGVKLYGGSNYETFILDIDMESGEDWNVNYSLTDKIMIAMFLLNYFFPPSSQEPVDVNYNTKLLTYITFDANSNIPSKIFGLLDQVINLITPLNIADSATTGENHLAVDKVQKRAGVKNKYAFPKNNDTLGYLYTSNIYSRQQITLQLKTGITSYDEKTKYDFIVNIPPISPIRFDDNNKSGSSVTYLSYLIAYNTRNDLGRESKMVELPAGMDSSILFDLKRSGDWEQCNAGYTINTFSDDEILRNRVLLCTLDRLCSLYSRCLGQNTIWHYGTHLKLYRFPGEAASPQAIEAFAEKERERTRILEEKKDYLSDKLRTYFSSTLYANLIQNGTIPGFNQKTPIGCWFANIGRKILEKIQRDVVTFISRTTDPESFFSTISEYSGQNVNVFNIEPFVEYFTSFKEMSKRRFFYYDYTLLSNMRDLIEPIYTFTTESKRHPRSIEIKNYKENLERAGLFATIEKIAEQTELITVEEIHRLQNVPYDTSTSISEKNISYYKELHGIIVPIINRSNCSVQRAGIRSWKGGMTMEEEGKMMEQEQQEEGKMMEQEQQEEGKMIEQEQEEQEEQEQEEEQEKIKTLQGKRKQNIFENLRFDLTNEMILFTSSINELCTNYITQMGGTIQEYSLDDFIINMFTIRIENDDISRLIVDFLENSSKLLKESNKNVHDNSSSFITTQKKIRTLEMRKGVKDTEKISQKNKTIKRENQEKRLKKATQKTLNTARNIVNQYDEIILNHMFIYILLASFDFIYRYDHMTPENKNTFHLFIFSFIDPIKTDSTGEKQINRAKFLEYLLQDFYPEYLPENIKTGQIFYDKHFVFMLRALLQLFFKVGVSGNNIERITQAALTTRDRDVLNPWNICMIVFVFFQNYFIYVIGQKTTINPRISPDHFGYYPGLLNFSHGVEIGDLFKKMTLTFNPSTSMISEMNENTLIYKDFSSTSFILLLYLRDKLNGTTNAKNVLRELKGLTGGKKTKKMIYKIKTKKRKQKNGKKNSKKKRKIFIPPNI